MIGPIQKAVRTVINKHKVGKVLGMKTETRHKFYKAGSKADKLYTTAMSRFKELKGRAPSKEEIAMIHEKIKGKFNSLSDAKKAGIISGGSAIAGYGISSALEQEK